MKLLIRGVARQDLQDGYYFFEEQQQGLGDYFLTCLYGDLEALLIYHGIHPQVATGIYRSLSKRFAYAIYYSIVNETIVVRAVIDCRRSPEWINKRLK